MTFATKVLWGIAFVGASGSVVYYVSTNKGSWSSLSQDSDFSEKMKSDYSQDVFAKDNAKYVLGLDAKNAPWWDVLLKRLNDDVASDPNIAKSSHDGWDGKLITIGYGINPETSLNKFCEKTYKSKNETIEGASSQGLSPLKKFDIFRYCSPIVTLALAGENYSNLGSEKSIGEDSKDKLMSTQKKVNDAMWESLTDEFFQATGKRSGSAAQANSLFKDFYEKNKSDRKNIKVVCEEAYQKSSSDSENKLDAGKFCTVY